MLKKIPVQQLRLGMHLVKLDASWLAHPLWRSRFTLDDPADVQRVQRSGVSDCWIDTGRGADVAADDATATALAAADAAPPPAVRATTAAARAPAAAAAPGPSRPARAGADRPIAAELPQAARVCEQARGHVVAMFHQARMGRAIDVDGCLPMVEEITASVARHPDAVVSLARLKSRDDYSYMHSVAVCALMVALARCIGLDDDGCREAGLAGLMHDIGKAVMPAGLLEKNDRLSDSEMAIVRTHPERGAALIADGAGLLPSTLDVVLHHHERFDGQGYPHRIDGPQLSALARMGALCDVYDAISSNRPYKTAWDPAESLSRMAGWQGQFDPRLLESLVQALGIYPVGSLVRLESGRLAVVVEQSVAQLLAPRVKVFHSTRTGHALAPRVVDLAAAGCQDRIVGREPHDDSRFPHLHVLWADADSLRRMRLHAPACAA